MSAEVVVVMNRAERRGRWLRVPTTGGWIGKPKCGIEVTCSFRERDCVGHVPQV